MITIKPTDIRYIDIRHIDWGCDWALQWPESIACDQGWIMDFQPIQPQWEAIGELGFQYMWKSDAVYLEKQREYAKQNPSLAHKEFIEGVTVEPVIKINGNVLERSITIHNGSNLHLTGVVCDGGCFQAKSPEFTGPDEPSRTYTVNNGTVTSLAELPRTQPERCMYMSNAEDYDSPAISEGEWFWGRCSAEIDVPAIMAMKSTDENKAVGVMFEGATAGSANADEHHCMHSRPNFGTLAPGDKVTRNGWIVFGQSIDEVISQLQNSLSYIPLKSAH